MRVVHVGTIDDGGAFEAMCRIHESMRMYGIDSKILLRSKTKKDSEGYCYNKSKGRLLVSKTKNLFNGFISNHNVHLDILGTDISRGQLICEADIIVLHWINSFLSLDTVKKLAEIGKPIIWVMHDMWLLTAGCHYDGYCGKYETACTDCNYMKYEIQKKIFENIFYRKKKILSEILPVLVCPSRWLMDCVCKSEITKDCAVYCIHNPINTQLYSPQSGQSIFKTKNAIPMNKKILLFGAMHATKNPNKGFHYIKEALVNYNEKDMVLVVYGNDEKDLENVGNVPIVYLGKVTDKNKLVEIYNIADVYIAPSKQDNYPNSVLEALTCGVPTVAFNIGGMSDLIRHKENGYLAEYDNVEDLYKGIKYCMANRDVLRINARAERIDTNSYKVIGKKYYELCKEVLQVAKDK